MSGPSLDHVSWWRRARLRPGDGWIEVARQGLRSWYIAINFTPVAPLAWRHGLGRRWGRQLERREGVRTDDRWPARTLVDDATPGIELYRANLAPGRSSERSDPRPSAIPVLLLVPTEDPFVTPALLDGIEALAPNLERRDVTGGHWLPRSRPDDLASWIAEHVGRAAGRHERRSAADDG